MCRGAPFTTAFVTASSRPFARSVAASACCSAPWTRTASSCGACASSRCARRKRGCRSPSRSRFAGTTKSRNAASQRGRPDDDSKKIVWGRKSVVSAVAALAILVLPTNAVWAQPHARVSAGLQQHLAANQTGTVDVIVRGASADIDAIAARQHLRIRKRLEDGAVLQASGAQLGALSSGASLDLIAGDVNVSSFLA